jgi:hypothetical protein
MKQDFVHNWFQFYYFHVLDWWARVLHLGRDKLITVLM